MLWYFNPQMSNDSNDTSVWDRYEVGFRRLHSQITTGFIALTKPKMHEGAFLGQREQCNDSASKFITDLGNSGLTE